MRLAIDIGGSHIKTALVENSRLEELQEIVTPRSRLDFERTIESIISKYRDIAPFTEVGIAVPGTVTKEGVVRHGGALPYLDNISFQVRFGNLNSLQISVQNDAKAALLGEMHFGSLKGIDNSAMIVLGTGVGVGACLDGHVIQGAHRQAGEVSFMVLDSHIQSPLSFVGTALSAVKLVDDLGKILGLPADGRIVFAHIDENEEAQRRYEEYCKQVALLIFNLQTILDIDHVVIGGGISSVPDIVTMLRQAYSDIRNSFELISETLEPIQIISASFAGQANLLGAVVPFINTENSDRV